MRSIAFSVLLLFCAGCDQHDASPAASNVARPAAAQVPAAVPSAQPQTAALPPQRVSVDDLMATEGRKTFEVDFKGTGAKTIVYYGRYSKDLAASTPKYTIRYYIEPGATDVTVVSGDYGLILAGAGPHGEAVAFPAGEAEFVTIANSAKQADGCWHPAHGEQALYTGRETAAGVLYYRGGWKWAQCGD